MLNLPIAPPKFYHVAQNPFIKIVTKRGPYDDRFSNTIKIADSKFDSR